MIPKIKNVSPFRSLRLIIHGSSGGYIHPLVNYVIKQVEYLRGSSVDLEVLTQKKPKHSRSSSVLVVPLLLLPGKHVQHDIPQICKRLNHEGINTQLLPFLGCWYQWISILKYFINIESQIGKPILLHHPLNNSIGSSYLEKLNRTLKIPIEPWSKWSKLREKEDPIYTPIPFSLTPNKNTKNLRTHDSISSLLEIDIFLFGLINILTHLP
ncbi:CbiX/SirB N-terminal domain-containing protein [Prochlorococcus sp. MIT 1223]|uniref:CbiX/SirB N-terminal domain-containing protein n=1 Tax=Prochlorococcus sp. MIT 1223 TaxID=3096217 RepID=UPI002A75AB46|nr:CbiX/SirB N-terminal domain-containing protein [Prochlorococcus sp. MIT 1223]